MSDKFPNSELCSLNIEGNIATIHLNRSDVFNALNTQLITELINNIQWTTDRSVSNNSSLRDSEGSEYLRVLVLTSAGKHFCAGADINMMRDAGTSSVENNRIDSERLDKLFYGLWAHPCFTIGCIQGVALGGGALLIQSGNIIKPPFHYSEDQFGLRLSKNEESPSWPSSEPLI